MKTCGLIRHSVTNLLIACAALSLLLTACQPGNVSTGLPPVQITGTLRPTEMTVAQATQTPAQATQPPPLSSSDITLNLSGVAQDQTVETVAAVPASADGPWWEAAPEYRRVTLQGYPVANHTLKPQIFIYPAADLTSTNETAGKMASDLQTLLKTRQAGDSLPFLPLIADKQAMHAQVQYLDVKNGQGVRFLTQYNNGMSPINNSALFYTYQGLTGDGKYYISAILPVTHPDLPATQQVSDQQSAEMNDFPAYLTKTVTSLNQQPGSSFTPDLAKLDALIQSIEVK